MSTDPRIEAAAKALYAADDNPWAWDDTPQQKFYRNIARVAIEGADKAATIATWERLDALPVGSRILLAGVHLERDPEPVDDGVWRDLSNALHLDDVDMRFLLERHAAHVTRWGKA